MTLYLVQHGKAHIKEAKPDRPLTTEGRADVERIAGVAAGYGVQVSEIRHSGKTRAAETAEIFGRLLLKTGSPDIMAGLGPTDEVEPIIEKLKSHGDIMLVGHQPFMGKMLAKLVAGDENLTLFGFQNGGIVCLEFNEDQGWYINWTLSPRIG